MLVKREMYLFVHSFNSTKIQIFTVSPAGVSNVLHTLGGWDLRAAHLLLGRSLKKNYFVRKSRCHEGSRDTTMQEFRGKTV